jgi:DNA-binding transcriptional LysR family regulator
LRIGKQSWTLLRMDLLGHMATFVRVVDANSLSGAARSLKISLPGVSRQLRALEEELGAQLLVRTTRRMALTERGRAFYESAVQILRDVENTRLRVEPSRAVRGRLVVSVPISIALALVLPRIGALAARHPRLTLELRLEDHLVDFVREGVDVALRGGVPPPDSTSYVAHPLSRFHRVLVASPRYLRDHPALREPEQLVRHVCLVQIGASGALTRWRLVPTDGGGEPRDVVVPVGTSSNAPIALRDLARQHMGVALLAEWLVHTDLKSGALRRVLPAWRSPEVMTYAIHRVEQRGAPAIESFLDAMRGL